MSHLVNVVPCLYYCYGQFLHEKITYVNVVLLQGKQRFLYSLLDAMQSLTSQAVVIGVSCRLV
jgi:hypothetical protein